MREIALFIRKTGTAIVLLLTPTACGSKDDCKATDTCQAQGGTANGGSNASGGSSGGAIATFGGSESGGALNAAGQGGEGGFAEAGAGGEAGAMSCSCGPFELCRAGRCKPCSALDDLNFGPVESLGISGRYPRPSPDGGLFYVDSGSLWFASDTHGLNAMQVTKEADAKDTAPLYVPGLESVLPNVNFFFVRTDASGSALFSGNWRATSPKSLVGLAAAPTPFNSADGLNFSLAVSSDAGRAWWRTTRSDVQGLVTAPLTGSDADIETFGIDIAVRSARCQASEYDPTAWVTPDGALLLFRESILDESCQHPLGFSTDLFAVALDPATGKPNGAAVSLGVLRGGNARDSDPAFASDCSLYFSSDFASNGTYQLYRAARK